MGEVATKPEFEMVIEPQRGWLDIRWGEIWDYRDLMWILVQRDFSSRFKQTLLGPAWFVIQPVLTAIIFTVIFGKVAGIATDGIPQPLFYLCGQLGWNYFAQTLTNGGASFVTNAHIFGKVYFPRLIVPIAIALSNLIAIAFQMIPFVAFYIYFKIAGTAVGIAPTVNSLWQLPAAVAGCFLAGLGVSLILSITTAKYRDLIHLNPFIVQMWMFATPIIYPLSRVPETMRWLAYCNPMTVPVELFRMALLGKGSLPPEAYAISLAVNLALLACGVLLFQRIERSVVDTV